MKKLIGILMVSFGLLLVGPANAQEEMDKIAIATIDIEESSFMCEPVSEVLAGEDGILSIQEQRSGKVEIKYNRDEISLNDIREELADEDYVETVDDDIDLFSKGTSLAYHCESGKEPKEDIHKDWE